MSVHSNIQWTDATWNCIRGCSRVSAGCERCYAEAVAARFSGPGLAYEGLARRRSNGEPQWTGEVRFIEEKLYEPLSWRTPKRVFVDSMSDLFHEQVSSMNIAQIFAVMALAPRHTFQVLTKRPARMRELLTDEDFRDLIAAFAADMAHERHGLTAPDIEGECWPLPNVWLGVSTENQATADERIPELLNTPAAIRFVSAEPLLGPIKFRSSIDAPGCGALSPLDWIIVGGESGRNARECDLAWIRDIVAQCANNSIACFVKQLGANPVDPWADTGALVMDREPAKPAFKHSHGGDIEEWPSDLQVREFPAVRV